MGNRRVMTKAKLEQAIALRGKRRTIAQIGLKIGVNPKTVDYHLRKEGVFPEGWVHQGDRRSKRSWIDKNGREVKGFTPAEDAIMTRMSSEGARGCDIARELNRPPNSVTARLTALANREACADD